jgi:hypothetical protein
MDTKRCVYCHKLQRADSQTCSRCGHAFVQKKPRSASRSRISRGLTSPSIPQASPHRVGHYSGLHPEDLPYQSSKIMVQRPPAPEAERRHTTQREPEHILLPGVDTPPLLDAPDEVTLPVRIAPDMQLPAYIAALPRKTLLSRRSMSVIIAISCIIFLLASSLLALTLMRRPPLVATVTLSASPNVLRANDTFMLTGSGFGSDTLVTFTYDAMQPLLSGDGSPLQAHADTKGAFSIQIHVPGNWKAGEHTIHATDKAQTLSVSTTITVLAPSIAPPHLQLSATTVDFAPAAPGVASSKPITLINAGGGTIVWQASSDREWLSISPGNGSFSGRANALLNVNRGSLAPGTYTGRIIFTQNDGAPAQILTVTMAVKPGPAVLNISTTSLTYSASTLQNPPALTVTLQNSGGQPLNWTSAVMTGDGAPWLSITPASGLLKPNTSAVITVMAQSQQLAPGSYQGTVSFMGGANAQVNVALTVVAPGNLVVAPQFLAFSAIAGQRASKTLTLQDNGGLPVNWMVSTATSDRGKWLSASADSGSLNAGAQVAENVTANSAGLRPGSYQGTLSFTWNGLTTPITIPVSLTVTVPPAAAISVQPTQLSFTTLKGSDPAQQSVTLTNTGNATLNWVATPASNGTSLLSVSPAQGSLPPGQSATLSVSPSLASSGAGTLTTTITIADTDAGSTVAKQTIAVTMTVEDQADITVSPSNLTFTNSSVLTNTSQPLTVGNDGSADLHWTVAQPADATASWLTVDTTSGTIAPGASTVLGLNCVSGSLAPGTYTAELVISDSDPGTPVAPQTVHITLVVGT